MRKIIFILLLFLLNQCKGEFNGDLRHLQPKSKPETFPKQNNTPPPNVGPKKDSIDTKKIEVLPKNETKQNGIDTKKNEVLPKNETKQNGTDTKKNEEANNIKTNKPFDKSLNRTSLASEKSKETPNLKSKLKKLLRQDDDLNFYIIISCIIFSFLMVISIIILLIILYHKKKKRYLKFTEEKDGSKNMSELKVTDQ